MERHTSNSTTPACHHPQHTGRKGVTDEEIVALAIDFYLHGNVLEFSLIMYSW